MENIAPSTEWKPLRLALIGYGKMGKAIEEIALLHGHTIALRISSENKDDLTEKNLEAVDVAIEFTGPGSAVKNISKCMEAGVPVISGSTGWLASWEEVTGLCLKKNAAFLYASNFSIGVNLFFELNKQLATLMARRPEYKVSIEEIHHTQKKDAPSGTAISIATDIIDQLPHKTGWKNEDAASDEDITITSKRIDPAPGTHIVSYDSAVDRIDIMHTAHNRRGFAEGAVLAAEFIAGKKGIFRMKDVLRF